MFSSRAGRRRAPPPQHSPTEARNSVRDHRRRVEICFVAISPSLLESALPDTLSAESLGSSHTADQFECCGLGLLVVLVGLPQQSVTERAQLFFLASRPNIVFMGLCPPLKEGWSQPHARFSRRLSVGSRRSTRTARAGFWCTGSPKRGTGVSPSAAGTLNTALAPVQRGPR